jgi:hypothetical protein
MTDEIETDEIDEAHRHAAEKRVSGLAHRHVVVWYDTHGMETSRCVEARTAADAVSAVRACFHPPISIVNVRPLRPLECPFCVNGEARPWVGGPPYDLGPMLLGVCSTCGRSEEQVERAFAARRSLW